jgi:hypothetical protein
MNLYFLSLIKEDRKRRNEIGLNYKFSIAGTIKPQKHYASYLKDRFPYIKKGDIISINHLGMKNFSWFWTENDPSDIIPFFQLPLFFYQYIEEVEYLVSFPFTLDMKKQLENKGSYYQINRFKIGNRRCTLKFVPIYDSIDNIEEGIKTGNSYIFYPVFHNCEKERRITLTFNLE